MSESDDETAFASADEGDEKKSQDGSKTEIKQDKGKASEAQEEVPGKGIEKKDTGQQKQAQKSKKKGNRSNQANTKGSKPTSSKTASSSSSKSDASTNSSPSTVDVKKENETTPSQPDIQEEKTSVPSEPGPVQSLAMSEPPASNEKSNTDSPAKSKGDSQKQEDKAAKASGGGDVKAATKSVENTQTIMAESPAEVKQNTETKTTETATSPEKQDIPREKMTRTLKQEEVLRNLEATAAEKNSGGSWGWSSWGSSILSAATSSVQTFTHQVGDGLSTIIDSVESSLGIPDPEELVKEKKSQEGEEESTDDTTSTITSQPEDIQIKEPPEEDKQKPKEKKVEVQENTESTQEEGKKEQSGTSGWFSSWGVSDLAKKVTNTGKSLASKGQTLMAGGFDAVENLAAGGIDVLETIGKKTYNTLSEHDPAFRKTRDFLTPKSNKPNLSSVLREARDKAEEEAEKARENEEARKAHFGTLFDDNQGLAHLEALEMLSNQSEKKVHSLLNSLSSKDLAEIKPLLISIKETFSIKEEEDSDAVEDQDVSGLVSQCLTQLKLGTASDKLNTVLDMVRQWITDFDKGNHEKDTTKDIHQKSIQALAELTAKGVEQFHKAGELILMQKNKETDFIEKSQSLARLTSVLCHEVGNLATGFVACLNKMAEKSESSDEITQFVTNIYLEATNSSTYIQDAFVLLLPVVQHAAIEHSVLFRES